MKTAAPWPRFLVVALGVLFACPSAWPAATLEPVSQPAVWESAEFRLSDVPQAHNPFDPEDVRIDVTFSGPTGEHVTIPAFWYQAYNRSLVDGKEALTAIGPSEWRVRFTPTQPGEYTAEALIAHGGATDTQPLASAHFSVTRGAAPARGWVTVAPDHRTFATTDGQRLLLNGENVCWPHERGTFDYDDWFAALDRAGMNVARLWMSPWWAPLEHVPGTLNHYRLDAAWELDQIFRLAAEHHIYLVFCFEHHGMFQVANQNWGGGNNFWKRNPYSVEAGGPCTSPNDFFVNPQAKALYEKKLRYLIGRYSSSPYLLAWEFFNEIDNVYPQLHGDDVAAWHRQMGAWLHAHDPYHHLVTTSLTGGSERPEIYSIPELDFDIYHSYADAAPARTLAGIAAAAVQRYGKPMWIGEFGTSARAWEIAGDPHLRGFRQGLWGGAVGGSAGTAAPWWWEDIHSSNAYPYFTHIRDVLARAGVAQGDWMPATFVTPGSPPDRVGEPIAGSMAFDADLPIGGRYRVNGNNAVAIADPLSASRTAEQLNHFLRADGKEADAQPMRVDAWFGPGAKVVAHVDSVLSAATLRVEIDGREVARTPLPDKDGRDRPSKEYDADFSYDVPAGHHTVGLSNVGRDWIYLDHLRVEHVLPSTLADNWHFAAEPIGLRHGNSAVVYVVSPWVVWPAGADLEHPAAQSGQTITLNDWAAGDYTANWYSPATGAWVGTTRGSTEHGTLTVPLPSFDEDLAGVIAPTK